MNCPCMKNGQCSKRYPKSFRDATLDQEDGYPEYRRRNNGGHRLPNGLCVDNRWVVPYNRALLMKYNAHINVEVCGSIYAVKYLHKYIHKGGDRAEVEYAPNVAVSLDGHHPDPVELVEAPQEHDEVRQFQEGRYISTSEAVWRAFAFPLQQGRFFHVMHLDLSGSLPSYSTPFLLLPLCWFHPFFVQQNSLCTPELSHCSSPSRTPRRPTQCVLRRAGRCGRGG
jgi:hypothetical protein